MRKDIRGKTKEDDSNKLLIDDVSDIQNSRKAYSPAKDCHLIIALIITDLHLTAPLYALIL